MSRLSACVMSTLVVCCALPAFVSAESITLPNGTTAEIPDGIPDDQKKELIQQMMAGGESAKPPTDKPAEEKKEGEEKKEENGEEKKKDGKGNSKVVKRPKKPPKEPDLSELDAMPENGKILLQFRGHSWESMIEWYSRASGRDVQWLELPDDWVNLTTQRPYSIAETGDFMNRLLLSHGYTMLDDGEFMQVVKTAGLNPAFVPRVSPQQLATMQPFSFVRASFDLKRFKAEELVKELEAMKSPQGKLIAMKAANRIEAMDCVQNLRDIYAAIDAEQSSGAHAPKEFVIEWLRADMVKKKLEEMFSGGGSAPPLTPEQMQQNQQAQQNGQPPPFPPPGAGGGGGISIVVNELRNSIIIKATPREMLDITDAVRLLDVQPRRDSLDIKAYTLATRSPSEVSEILSESGALSPDAIVRVDKKTKTLLVSASAVDHYRIAELIETIDGNARRFVPIRLRRLPALQVATTIRDMMGEPKEESNNRRSRYSYWGYGYGNDEEEDDKKQGFRVAADVDNNRLILKCNDQEYEMVVELLTSMGEVMTRSEYGGPREVVLDGLDAEDALLERVRELFNTNSPNDVILPPPRPEIDLESESKEAEPTSENDSDKSSSEEDDSDLDSKAITQSSINAKIFVSDDFIDIVPPAKPLDRYETLFTQAEITEAEFERAAEQTREATKPKKSGKQGAPIIIRRDAKGRLVMRSDDPVALEKFEELLRQMAPPTQDWVHFKLKHVTALWMKLQLKDFFKEDDDENSTMFVWDYWGNDNNEDEKPPGLGEERKMRFIDDGESTLVVRNASARQLAIVRDLIKLYDVAEPPNDQNARFTEIVEIKHSKARVIETVLKDAFRDLLSSTDKAFAQQGGEEGSENRSRRIGPFNLPSTSSASSALQGTSFKGKISFGVDESTNRLIVTAEGKKLLELVLDYIEKLDVAATETVDNTRVSTIPANMNRMALQKTLLAMFGPDTVQQVQQPSQENQQGQPQGGDANQPQPNGQ